MTWLVSVWVVDMVACSRNRSIPEAKHMASGVPKRKAFLKKKYEMMI